MKYPDTEEFRRAHLILNTIQDACLEINSSGAIVFVNIRTKQLFGREKDKLIGRYLWEVFSEPSDTSGVGAIKKALTEKQSSQIEYFSPFFQSNIFLNVIAEDNSSILLIRKLTAIPAPATEKIELEKAEQEILRLKDKIATASKDITDQKHYEASLRATEGRQTFLLKLNDTLRPIADPVEIMVAASELLGKYLATGRVGYGEVDETRTCLNVTRDWTNGVMSSAAGVHRFSDFGEVMNAAFLRGDIFILEDALEVFGDDPRVLKNYKETGALRASLTVPLLKQGRVVAGIYIQQSTPRKWSEADIQIAREVIGRTWDAVERARAESILHNNEEQLKKLLKLRDDFIGIASHELKTPVASMKAYGEIVQRRLQAMGNNQDSELLIKMNAQINRLTTLINDLLDTTKIAEGQLKLTFGPLNVNELLRERIDEIGRTASHQFELYTEELPWVSADGERIGQVVTNLLSNAIKYSPQGTTITVSTRKLSDHIQVSIQDQGYGISEEDQKKIFDRFFRVTANNMDTFPGMGLGLYITAQIIQRHNGTIHVKSKPGEGSVFEFTIPVLSIND